MKKINADFRKLTNSIIPAILMLIVFYVNIDALYDYSNIRPLFNPVLALVVIAIIHYYFKIMDILKAYGLFSKCEKDGKIQVFKTQVLELNCIILSNIVIHDDSFVIQTTITIDDIIHKSYYNVILDYKEITNPKRIADITTDHAAKASSYLFNEILKGDIAKVIKATDSIMKEVKLRERIQKN